MRKQTDLAKVKQTALALLSTEINETPYSPMIVKHPFTDTGVSAIPDGNGGVTMLDLTEDDAQFKWRQQMARQIDKADNPYAIYMMVTKPYALTFLKFAMPHLSREDMSQILASAWTRSEAPHQDVNVTVNQLLRMFKQADPASLMEQDEYIQFKTLDDTVTVYRGVTPHNAKSVKALSWSLNQETAEWFAHRFGEQGTVYEAQIDKKYILISSTRLPRSTIGEEMRNEKVTPSGKPALVNPINNGIDEQEQNGVTVPSKAAIIFAHIP